MEIHKVKALPDYVLDIEFTNGQTFQFHTKPFLLKGNLFKELLDPSYFSRVQIDEHFGGLEWPNGADICIDVIVAEMNLAKKG